VVQSPQMLLNGNDNLIELCSGLCSCRVGATSVVMASAIKAASEAERWLRALGVQFHRRQPARVRNGEGCWKEMYPSRAQHDTSRGTQGSQA
jgi:hypothetical protein